MPSGRKTTLAFMHLAAGIAAESDRGDAVAVNEQGAAIRTHGEGASGVHAAVYEWEAGGRDRCP